MEGDLIRQKFLEYFNVKGHTIMPSSSLVPAGDPTLLFTSAGMVPFKPFFMGEAAPPSQRLTSSQKSFRTTDVDEVGDHKHLTFFEMLGNFSIGDYFKKEAIAFAWEFVTQQFNLDPERLYVTIYTDDKEAYGHWKEDIGVPDERIYRYGNKDNWWGPAGTEGPCGPCSEIHYDGGIEYGCGTPECHPNHECERFVELWNLVFMQFYQDSEGNRTLLPAPSIDTGMGLERAAVILQGKRNLYETDLFQTMVEKVSQLCGKSYGEDRDTDYAIRVVTEHARSATFLIGDGVVPSNEGRGYVLRRIIRRAIRHGRRLGLEEAFLTHVAESAIQRFQAAYPELSTNREFILKVIALEEGRFSEAVRRGSDLLLGYIQGVSVIKKADLQVLKNILSPLIDGSLVADKNTVASNADQLLSPLMKRVDRAHDKLDTDFSPAVDMQFRTITKSFEILQRLRKALGDGGIFTGSDTTPRIDVQNLEKALSEFEEMVSRVPGTLLFQLYDTHGFPPELTAEIAREHGLEVDIEGFEEAMEAQRQRARSAHAFSGAMEMLPTYENLGVAKVDFVGYDQLGQESAVTALLVDQTPVGHATKGAQIEVVLETTPFYAEGGGQMGDAGVLTGPNGRVRINDTQSPVAGLVVHSGIVEEGDISLGDRVEAWVDPLRRQDTARNHSGTHLLHAALRQILGAHVRQAGSHVAPERLRFDYSHVSPLSKEELMQVQGMANGKVQDNLTVTTRESTYTQAVQEGALAFFGDRYGDVIRIVEMSDGERFSMEVCGGTHVGATGQIGPLFVLGDSSIGGGMRRIEAVTGRGAEGLFGERTTLLESISYKLQTPMNDLEARIDSYIEDVDSLRKQVASLERENLRREAGVLLQQVQDVDGVQLVAARTSASTSDAMREMGDWLKGQLSSVVVVLGAVQDGRPTVIAMVTPDLVSRGFHAGNIAKDTAQVMDGGGGGRPEMAQAGGKRADKLEEAIRRVPDVLKRQAAP